MWLRCWLRGCAAHTLQLVLCAAVVADAGACGQARCPSLPRYVGVIAIVGVASSLSALWWQLSCCTLPRMHDAILTDVHCMTVRWCDDGAEGDAQVQVAAVHATAAFLVPRRRLQRPGVDGVHSLQETEFQLHPRLCGPSSASGSEETLQVRRRSLRSQPACACRASRAALAMLRFTCASAPSLRARRTGATTSRRSPSLPTTA